MNNLASKPNLLNKFNYVIWKPPITEEMRADLEEWEVYDYVDWWPRIKAAPYKSVDFETQSVTETHKDAVKHRYNEIVSAQISWREGDRVRTVYVPFRHSVYKFNWGNPLEFLKELLDTPRQLTIYHNATFEFGCCVTEGYDESIGKFVGFRPSFPYADTEIMCWVYDENLRPKLKTLMEELLGWKSLTISNLFANEKYGAFPPEAVAAYSCQDSYGTLLLYEFFMENFTPAQKQLYFGLEQHITNMLCEATWNGVGIDKQYLKTIVRMLKEKEKELHEEVSQKLNADAGSAKAILAQLKANGHSIKSTASEYLDRWLSLYDFTLDEKTRQGLHLLRPLRYIQKYLKTYLFGKTGGIATHIYPDGCVRPKWWQWSFEEGGGNKKGKQRGTVNGRFSCSQPSFNTLIKDPKEPDLEEWMEINLPGVKLRKLIVPPDYIGNFKLEDYVVLCGDGSQIEMRTTASAAQEQLLINFFEDGYKDNDLYSMFATFIFGRKITKKDKLQRQIGKGVVLGANYGAGAKKLAKKIWKYVLKDLYPDHLPLLENGMPDEESIEIEIVAHIKKLIANLKESFPGLGTYHKRVEALALKNGGKVTTRTGRTRTIPGFKKGHFKGVLQLANAKPQNEAADIIKMAMKEFREKTRDFARPVFIAANVHDEILAFVHKLDVVSASVLLNNCIISKEWVLEPRVRLEASISAGVSWGAQIDFNPATGLTPENESIIEQLEKELAKKKAYDPERVKDAISKVTKKAKPCTKCEFFQQYGNEKVFIEGRISTKPRLVIVGANPGKEDRIQKRIFCGKTGSELREEMRQARLPVDDAVWLNALFCFSPDTEGIQQGEINNCKGYLHELLEALQPEVVLCLGSIAQRAVLDNTLVGVEVGWKNTNAPYRVFVNWHPAGVSRDVSLEDSYREGLMEVSEYLNA